MDALSSSSAPTMDQDAPKAPECSMCNDSTLENDSIETINDILICTDCIRMIVQRVVDGRDSFPPKINRREFIEDPCHNELSNTLGHALFEQYMAAKRANGVAPVDRVYCQCGTFVAKRLEPADSDTSSAVRECCNDLCRHLLCLFCSTVIESSNTEDDHSCKEKVKAHENAQQKLLDARERGAEYQICPNQDCKRVVNLAAACHHISCHCGTGFCYSCGAESDHDDHWGPGGCARYLGEPPLAPEIPIAERIRRFRERLRGQQEVLMQNLFANPADGEEDLDFEDFAAPQLQEWAAARDNAYNNNNGDDENDNDLVATEEAIDGQEEARSIAAAEEVVQGREDNLAPRPRYPLGWAPIRASATRTPSDEGSEDGDDEEDEAVHHNEG